MGVDVNALRATIEEQTQTFGEAATLRSMTKSYVPGTGALDSATPSTIYIVIDEYKASEISGLVKIGDIKVISTTELKAKDEIIIDGVTRNIISVTKNKMSGTVIAYEAQVR